MAAVCAAAGRIERVKVTDRAVSVTREGGRWTKLIWESPTAFTRVDLTTEDHRAIDLQLALSAERATVAGGLSPSERAVFAHALEQAIGAARRARG